MPRLPSFAAAIALSLSAIGVVLAMHLDVAKEAEPAQDAYDELMATMQDGLDQNAISESSSVVSRRVFAANEEIAALEEESPGFVDDVMKATDPILRSMEARSTSALFTEYERIFRETFTVAEASEMSEILRTPAFRKLMSNVRENLSADSIRSSVESSQPVLSELISQTNENAQSRAISSLTPAEYAEVESVIASSIAWQKYSALQPELASLQAKLGSTPVNPDVNAALDAAYAQVYAKHFPE